MTKIGIYYNIKHSEKKQKRIEDNTEVNLTPLTNIKISCEGHIEKETTYI